MTPYKKGYLKELEAKRILKRRKKFHTIFRAASTHSPFDIVAISGSKVLFLQQYLRHHEVLTPPIFVIWSKIC